MRKLMAILLAALLLFSLVACAGPKKEEPKKTEAPATVEEKKEETKTEEVTEAAKEAAVATAEAAPAGGTAHVFYYTYADTYISSVRAALDKALEGAGVKFQDYDSNNSPTTQSEQVQTAMSNAAAMLVVNIVNTSSEDAAMDIAKIAKDKKVPLLFFNREVTDDVVKSYENCVFVGTNAPEAGHMQGKMIGEFLLKDYEKYDLNGDGVISYVMFKGEEGNNEAIYRTQFGVEDADAALKEAGKPVLEFYDKDNANKYLVDQGGAWSAAAAKEYMSIILSQYNMDSKNMVELVICNNDGMAEGAISALEEAGFNLGKEKESTTIPVFGVDATDAAKALIAEGKMAGTIKQDAEGMAAAIAKLVANGLAGKPLLEGSDLVVDENVAKVRIPYQIYTGE